MFHARKGGWNWDGRNIAGIFISILISLTSSIDRECGAGLYLVLFASLLQFPLREAIALTAFTTFLGTLGPGLAATREAVSTERGPMAAVDYPSAVLILPCMYYGISFGVIVNAALPWWLLSLGVVIQIAISNIELLISIALMVGAKREILRLAETIKAEAQALAMVASGDPFLLGVQGGCDTCDDGDAAVANGGAAAAGESGGPGAGGSGGLRQALCCGAGGAVGAEQRAGAKAEGDASVQGRREALEQLRARVRKLHRRATQIEALALLFPAFHFPTHHEIARLAKTDVDTIFGRGHGLSREPQHADSAEVADRACRGASTHSMAGDWAPSEAGGHSGGSGGCCGRRGAGVWTNTGGVPVAPPPLPAGRLGRLRRWWGMQPGFELSLVFKIVILHLFTEFLRHAQAKPCTKRFWFMLFVIAGCVTILLMSMAASFCRKRLWRGPRWLDAQAVIRHQHAAEEAAKDPEAVYAIADADADAGREASRQALAADDDAAAAAGGDRAAGQLHHLHHKGGAAKAAAGVGVSSADAAFLAAGARRPAPPPTRNPLVKAGRWFRAHSPFRVGAFEDAIKCDHACVSQDGFSRWSMWRVIGTELAAFPLAVLGCALGFPGGPALSWLLLGLRIKPHIVAATSRYLVMTFTFGSFIAYIIAGNLRVTYALAYGLINLVVAPLGMALFRRLSLPSHILLVVSAVMGLTAMGAIIATELVPWMGAFLDPESATQIMQDENLFDIGRFCFAHHRA